LQIATVFWPGLSNYFSQLLNTHGVSDARQTDIHTAEPLVPETSVSGLIIAGSKAFGCEILILIISIWNKEELPEEWKESIIVPVDMKSDKTECFNYR